MLLITDDAQQALANISLTKRIKILLGRVVTTYSKDEMFSYAIEETRAELSSGSNATEDEFANDTDIKTTPSAPKHWMKEDTVDEISLKGLESMLLKFLGDIGEFPHEEMAELFKQVDTDGSGLIDRDEFDTFLESASDDSRNNAKANGAMEKLGRRASTSKFTSMASSDSQKRMLGGEHSIEYMKSMITHTERPLDDWSIFYCGGSSPVEKSLRSICEKYSINLAIEKFNW